MILPDDYMTLQRHDSIVTSAVDGTLIVYRTVELRVCRCRECGDKCERLGEGPHTTCPVCHNNHSQAVDGIYKGPLKGTRQAGQETLSDLNERDMTCRLCGEHWGEGHDMPGRCPFYNSDGSLFQGRDLFSGRIPVFKGENHGQNE